MLDSNTELPGIPSANQWIQHESKCQFHCKSQSKPRVMMQLGTNDSLPKNLLLILLLPVPISRHTCMLLYATKDTHSFRAKKMCNRKCKIDLRKYCYTSQSHCYTLFGYWSTTPGWQFFHTLCSVISQLLTQMTMNSSSWSRVTVVTVNHWHFAFFVEFKA